MKEVWFRYIFVWISQNCHVFYDFWPKLLLKVTKKILKLFKKKVMSFSISPSERLRSLIIWASKIPYVIPEAVCSSVPFLHNKFCIKLALPISPEIMDGFWCSRCLNYRNEVPEMMRLFAGGATTPW